jgi:hypothetical protein
MYELIPVLLGLIFGVLIGRTKGMARPVLRVAGVAASGLVATVLSGEYFESWVYVLLDVGEAALGLVAGIAIAELAPRSHLIRARSGPFR